MEEVFAVVGHRMRCRTTGCKAESYVSTDVAANDLEAREYFIRRGWRTYFDKWFCSEHARQAAMMVGVFDA